VCDKPYGGRKVAHLVRPKRGEIAGLPLEQGNDVKDMNTTTEGRLESRGDPEQELFGNVSRAVDK